MRPLHEDATPCLHLQPRPARLFFYSPAPHMLLATIVLTPYAGTVDGKTMSVGPDFLHVRPP